MKKRFKILACTVTALSAASVAHPTLAANRSFPAISAVHESATSAACFSHDAGEYLRNDCPAAQYVYLPMSFDNAAYYSPWVYGQGTFDASGQPQSVYCRPWTVDSLGRTTSNVWRSLPVGGPQRVGLDLIPIYSPGDSGYLQCWMQPNTKLFSVGWN